MDNNVIVENVSTEDVETIFELGQNISGFEVSKDIVSFWPKRLLINSINKEDVVFLKIKKLNIIIGFIIINLNYSLSKAEIEDIYIIESERNNGYGSMLLKMGIEVCRNKGINYKIEYVNALTNTAEGFFEKNHFLKGNNFNWFSLALTDIFKK